MARDFQTFETALRTIRYENGKVEWSDRNHYFAEWIRRANEKGIGRPVDMQPSITIDKTVNWKDQGRRQVSIAAIPKATFFANRHLLAPGDVIGFVSRRADLDFYHTGLIAFGKNSELLLRHASQSRGRDAGREDGGRSSAPIRWATSRSRAPVESEPVVGALKTKARRAESRTRLARRPAPVTVSELIRVRRCAAQARQGRVRPRHHRSGGGSGVYRRRDAESPSGSRRGAGRQRRSPPRNRRAIEAAGRAPHRNPQARGLSV